MYQYYVSKKWRSHRPTRPACILQKHQTLSCINALLECQFYHILLATPIIAHHHSPQQPHLDNLGTKFNYKITCADSLNLQKEKRKINALHPVFSRTISCFVIFRGRIIPGPTTHSLATTSLKLIRFQFPSMPPPTQTNNAPTH